MELIRYTDELTKSQSPERLQLPEISQPICTALQLAQLAVMQAAGIKCEAVAGHSSGEIAAAVAAGRLTPAQAIKIAYYRGVATSMATYSASVGMLAAGLGPNEVAPYIEETSIQIACYNSPASVTLSGVRSELEIVEAALKKDGHFARLLKVDAAYHSRHMNPTAGLYQDMLDRLVNWKETPKPKGDVTMYSSTLGKQLGNDYELGPDYWVKNMVSPVLFSQATSLMLLRPEGTDVLVEVGPSNALSGPINQIKATVANKSFEYMTASKRGSEALHSMFHLAGKLFVMGAPVQLAAINQDHELQSPSFIYDLPNYSWNHSTKYWYESEASVDWRHRKFVHHDLLGGKILGIPWTEPQWKKVLVLNEHPWLRDHKV
jgi:acyl transferase domain-containing protein